MADDRRMLARSGGSTGSSQAGRADDAAPMTEDERRSLEDALAASLAEMERGEVFDMDEVLAQAE